MALFPEARARGRGGGRRAARLDRGVRRRGGPRGQPGGRARGGARGRRRGASTSTPTGSGSGSTGRTAPTRAWSCTCTAAASSSTTSTCTTGRCRRFANRLGMAVLSVDYRLAPEHRFPAAPDDVDTVLGWLDREGAALGLGGPTYVHGDSAGGNLALVAALRHPGRFRRRRAALPVPRPDRRASRRTRSAPPRRSTRARPRGTGSSTPPAPDDLTDPDLAPLLSDRLGTLPPTLVTTAEHDPLRDEGEHLAALDRRAGRPGHRDPLPRPGPRLLAARGLPGGRAADAADRARSSGRLTG